MKVLECAACADQFDYDVTQPRKKYCSPECSKTRKGGKHVARADARKAHRLTFYAVDGEGENRALQFDPEIDPEFEHPFNVSFERYEQMDDDLAWEKHLVIKYQDYIMLSVGDQTLTKNGKILTHEDIFPFLYARFLDVPEAERKYAVFVGFRLQYDFTMFVRSFFERQGMRMFSKDGIADRRPSPESGRYGSQPVYVTNHGSPKAQWEVDFLGMKRMKLRPHVAKKDWVCEMDHKSKETIEAHEAGTCKRHPYQWMFICDSSSYFQGAFLGIIDPKIWGDYPIVSQDEYDILCAGKANRQAAKYGPEMERYNLMENAVLARIMERMNDGFVNMGIRIPKDKWYGPGAAAQLWLKLNGMPTAKEIEEHVPSWALDAGQYAYYGGRFENAMHGTVPGKMYNYDINSAYPFAIAEMPCLLHGQWTRGEGDPGALEGGSLRLVRAKVKGRSNYLGPLPYRNVHGGVLFPTELIGWYWQFEIDAAKKASLITSVKVLDWVDYNPCACPPPVAKVRDAYQERMEVGKNTPHGKALKLVVNSLYGKYAQSIGLPTYACSLYASYITARCRTQILDAIASHPQGAKAVSKIATDGVYFTSQHPGLAITKELGDWDETVYENMSFFLPGVDWDDKTREKLAKTGKASGDVIRSRGVSAQKLAENITSIDPQWENLKLVLKEAKATGVRSAISTQMIDGLPSYKVNLGWGYVSPKLAAARGKWNMCGVSQFHEERQLNSDMVTKRRAVYLDGHIIRSLPWAWGSSDAWMYASDAELETCYYDKTFGRLDENEDDIFSELSGYVQPDGSLAQYLGSIKELTE